MLDASQVQAGLQRGQQLAQAGRMPEAWVAIAPLRAAIEGHSGALRLYALVAQNAGKTDEAIWALERIIILDREPPEIVGALADTLGKAGRHSQAYEAWSRLVAKQPGAVDAHLNRAIAATNANLHDEALAAAELGLQQAPGHARLLSVRAMALKNLGRIGEAVAAYGLAVAADPERALTRYNQAVTLRVACQYDEACEAYAEAERLGSSGAAFLSNWAAAALEAGRVEEADSRYRDALRLDPGLDEARRGLTRLLIEYGDGTDAFAHYRDAAERGNRLQAWADYQLALLANKRYAQAAEAGREAMARLGRDPAILRGTLFAEGIAGEPEAALAALEQLPPRYRDDAMGLIARAQIALRAGEAERCATLCLAYNDEQPEEQTGWTLLSLAWRAMGDPREHWLCDYERLVMPVDVPSPDGTMTAADYARVVAEALDPLHTALAAPGDQSLRHGTQTSGDLFSRPQEAIQEFRRAVLDAAAKAVAKLPDDDAHPFLRRKSNRFDFYGSWSVRLAGGGGHHIPHFHGHGWMSSAYYARLPKFDATAEAEHQGWIEFGRPPDMFRLDFEPRRVVQPTEGRLVLFPSYLWHGTVPFHAGIGDRLTAAFDYRPL